jgi:hypothetical protein
MKKLKPIEQLKAWTALCTFFFILFSIITICQFMEYGNKGISLYISLFFFVHSTSLRIVLRNLTDK